MNTTELIEMLKAKGYTEKSDYLIKRKKGNSPTNEKIYVKDDKVVFITAPGRFYSHNDIASYWIAAGNADEPLFYPFYNAAEKYIDKKIYFLSGSDSSGGGSSFDYGAFKDYFLAVEFTDIKIIKEIPTSVFFKVKATDKKATKDVMNEALKNKPVFIELAKIKKSKREADYLKAMLIKKELFDAYIEFYRTLIKTVDVTQYIALNSTESDKKYTPELSRNLLIYGAPGTGKSHYIDDQFKKEFCSESIIELLKQQAVSKLENERLSTENLSDDDIKKDAIRKLMTRVTFYDGYDYESFVGCYKPVMEEEKITYRFEPGPFINIYMEAIKNPNLPYLLAIEELNRADAAAVFGDLFQLLDRDGNGNSEYAVKPEASLDKYLSENLADYQGTISLPDNLYIWATMNSADQDVYVLDSAFKRRWQFKYMDINSEHISEERTIILKTKEFPEGKEYYWDTFRKAINAKLQKKYEEDRWIGSWFFKTSELKMINAYMGAKDRSNMVNPLADKLLTYLLQDVVRLRPEDLFHNEYRNISAVRSALAANTPIDEIIDIGKLKTREDADKEAAPANAQTEDKNGEEKQAAVTEAAKQETAVPPEPEAADAEQKTDNGGSGGNT